MVNQANSQPLVTVDCEITGVTPLMMCAFRESQLKRSSPSRKEGILPRDEAENYTYKNKKGNLIIPARCLMASLIESGRFKKLGKKQLTTGSSTVVTAGIRILEQECDLGTKKYEIDSQPVVIQATQGRIMRHRPRLDEWSTKFTLTVNTDFLVSNHNFTVELANELLVDAGRICGVLAYRPFACKGIYGTFAVTKFKIKK